MFTLRLVVQHFKEKKIKKSKISYI